MTAARQLCEQAETLDELRLDAQHPPRVGVHPVGRAAGVEQPLVGRRSRGPGRAGTRSARAEGCPGCGGRSWRSTTADSTTYAAASSRSSAPCGTLSWRLDGNGPDDGTGKYDGLHARVIMVSDESNTSLLARRSVAPAGRPHRRPGQQVGVGSKTNLDEVHAQPRTRLLNWPGLGDERACPAARPERARRTRCRSP